MELRIRKEAKELEKHQISRSHTQGFIAQRWDAEAEGMLVALQIDN